METDKIKELLFVGIISGVLVGMMVSAAFIFTQDKAGHPATMTEGVYKTIVLNPIDFVKSEGENPTPESTRKALEKMKRVANELALEGYIVLTPQAVHKVPASAIFDPATLTDD